MQMIIDGYRRLLLNGFYLERDGYKFLVSPAGAFIGDGELTNPVSSKALNVLCVLAAYKAGCNVSAEDIGYLAFNHKTPSTSRLASYVSELRGVLGLDAIRRVRGVGFTLAKGTTTETLTHAQHQDAT